MNILKVGVLMAAAAAAGGAAAATGDPITDGLEVTAREDAARGVAQSEDHGRIQESIAADPVMYGVRQPLEEAGEPERLAGVTGEPGSLFISADPIVHGLEAMGAPEAEIQTAQGPYDERTG